MSSLYDTVRREALDAGLIKGLVADTHSGKGDLDCHDVDRERLAEWVESFHRNGIALITNLPPREDALQEFISKSFQYSKLTTYGESFTIEALDEPNNLAYSDIGLQLHTDLPFYSEPPAIQLFHCLLPATIGGESFVCDGEALALRMRDENPDAYHTLTSQWLKFQDLSPHWHLEAEHPIIREEQGRIKRICFNERNRDSWRSWNGDKEGVERFYHALDAYTAMVDDPQNHLNIHLQAGEVIVVDNWRLMHARKGFSGPRKFCGAYVDWDAALGLWRRSSRSRRQ